MSSSNDSITQGKSTAMVVPQSQFGGGGKSASTGSPANTATSLGHSPHSTVGANDWSNFTQISYGGLSGFGMVLVAAAQAVLIAEQINLAQNYYDTNLKDFQFFASNYAGSTVDGDGTMSGPGNGPIVSHKDQAFTTPFYAVDYNLMTGAALGRTKVYDDQWFQTRRRLHRYAIGLGKQTDYNFYMARAKAATSLWVSGRRLEDARKDWKDEQIQTHKVQALNFGITAGNIASQGLASATNTLEHAYDEFGSRVGGLSSGLGQYNGYKNGSANATKYLNSQVRHANDGGNMAPHAMENRQ